MASQMKWATALHKQCRSAHPSHPEESMMPTMNRLEPRLTRVRLLVALILAGLCVCIPVQAIARPMGAGQNHITAPTTYVRLSQGGGVVGKLYRGDLFYVLSRSSVDGNALWGYAEGRNYQGCGWIN